MARVFSGVRRNSRRGTGATAEWLGEEDSGGVTNAELTSVASTTSPADFSAAIPLSGVVRTLSRSTAAGTAALQDDITDLETEVGSRTDNIHDVDEPLTDATTIWSAIRGNTMGISDLSTDLEDLEDTLGSHSDTAAAPSSTTSVRSAINHLTANLSTAEDDIDELQAQLGTRENPASNTIIEDGGLEVIPSDARAWDQIRGLRIEAGEVHTRVTNLENDLGDRDADEVSVDSELESDDELWGVVQGARTAIVDNASRITANRNDINIISNAGNAGGLGGGGRPGDEWLLPNDVTGTVPVWFTSVRDDGINETLHRGFLNWTKSAGDLNRGVISIRQNPSPGPFVTVLNSTRSNGTLIAIIRNRSTSAISFNVSMARTDRDQNLGAQGSIAVMWHRARDQWIVLFKSDGADSMWERDENIPAEGVLEDNLPDGTFYQMRLNTSGDDVDIDLYWTPQITTHNLTVMRYHGGEKNNFFQRFNRLEIGFELPFDVQDPETPRNIFEGTIDLRHNWHTFFYVDNLRILGHAVFGIGITGNPAPGTQRLIHQTQMIRLVIDMRAASDPFSVVVKTGEWWTFPVRTPGDTTPEQVRVEHYNENNNRWYARGNSIERNIISIFGGPSGTLRGLRMPVMLGDAMTYTTVPLEREVTVYFPPYPHNVPAAIRQRFEYPQIYNVDNVRLEQRLQQSYHELGVPHGMFAQQLPARTGQKYRYPHLGEYQDINEDGSWSGTGGVLTINDPDTFPIPENMASPTMPARGLAVIYNPDNPSTTYHYSVRINIARFDEMVTRGKVVVLMWQNYNPALGQLSGSNQRWTINITDLNGTRTLSASDTNVARPYDSRIFFRIGSPAATPTVYWMPRITTAMVGYLYTRYNVVPPTGINLSIENMNTRAEISSDRLVKIPAENDFHYGRDSYIIVGSQVTEHLTDLEPADPSNPTQVITTGSEVRVVAMGRIEDHSVHYSEPNADGTADVIRYLWNASGSATVIDQTEANAISLYSVNPVAGNPRYDGSYLRFPNGSAAGFSYIITHRTGTETQNRVFGVDTHPDTGGIIEAVNRVRPAAATLIRNRIGAASVVDRAEELDRELSLNYHRLVEVADSIHRTDALTARSVINRWNASLRLTLASNATSITHSPSESELNSIAGRICFIQGYILSRNLTGETVEYSTQLTVNFLNASGNRIESFDMSLIAVNTQVSSTRHQRLATDSTMHLVPGAVNQIRMAHTSVTTVSGENIAIRFSPLF